ncbi:MAG: hypothetical protein E7F06_06415 [Lachnospiraceae bacterium]|nr:hypothetical protein [Lachnospiraceae bacterium]
MEYGNHYLECYILLPLPRYKQEVLALVLGKKSVHKWELMMLVPGKNLDRKQGPVLMVPDKRSAGSLGQWKCLAMALLFLHNVINLKAEDIYS